MAVSLSEVVSFGRYEPLFRIASGGMAEVYAARIRGEAGFQKLVAVKRMHPHLASDAGFVDMFLNEARLAAHIASPYVVQTLDLGRGSDGSLYIVMELVVGISLSQLMTDEPGPLPVPVVVELMAQAAQGLDDAHEATTPAGDPLGLIHRDISPHNLLLGLDGRARLTDFGIAHAIHRPREETNVKELKGKFAYMSPEQTRLTQLDRRSDVFSLGIVLWESLVGRQLFVDRDPTESIRNVRNAPIPAPHEEVPTVPPAISRVVLKALERDRDKRFATSAELAHELRRAGREALRELPTRKAIGAFVRDSGGEELQRLRRLIRLGTDGAAPEAIEAVKAGATKVLTGSDASGVARLGERGARFTEMLVDGAAEGGSVLSLSVVTLAPDDEPEQTRSINLLSGHEVHTDVGIGDQATLDLPSPDDTSGDDAGPTRDVRVSRRPPPTPEEALPTKAWPRVDRSAAQSSVAPSVSVARAAPVAPPPRSARVWVIGALVAMVLAAACFSVGVGLALVVPDAVERRPLPANDPSAMQAPPRPTPSLPLSGELPSSLEPDALDSIGATPTQEVPADEAQDPESEPTRAAPPEPEPPAPTTGSTGRRTPARGRARRRASPGSRGDLMGVDAFDRHNH